MKERPILFSAPMVRALLDGTKTQTRRALRYQPIDVPRIFMKDGMSWVENQHGVELPHWPCPYGQPGDRLWVRETHAQALEVDIPAGRQVGPIGTAGTPARPEWKSRYVYSADGEMPNVQWHHIGDSQPVRWTPSIHMPRAASRILLEVVSVRVERLQDISDDDAIAEGVDRTNTSICGYATERYRRLWEQINGAGSWEANPWVWVIEFRKIS